MITYIVQWIVSGLCFSSVLSGNIVIYMSRSYISVFVTFFVSV